VVRPLHQLGALESAVYQLIVLAWLGSEVWIAVRVLAKRAVYGPPGGLGQDRWSGPALIVGVFVSVWAGLALASAVPQASMGAGAPFAFLLGALLAVSGITLRMYSVVSLGRYFELRVTTSAQQPVIEAGPYGLIRHPSYAGGLLTLLGVQLMMTNWLALACFVLAWPGFAYRIRVEEAALSNAIGEPYRGYMRRTRRIIPFVL
jgi:protein-S-isoprenylcysteine O-methyltransferase Ste14